MYDLVAELADEYEAAEGLSQPEHPHAASSLLLPPLASQEGVPDHNATAVLLKSCIDVEKLVNLTASVVLVDADGEAVNMCTKCQRDTTRWKCVEYVMVVKQLGKFSHAW